ncbi:MAG TPA: HI0074 family nucleotidyltransferase substrate-binding subunit [Vicinamibacteria bacterium]|nr:HI0074 family nucleotidyltransferase substrate-binding subunit [Vicinamibacteria bacterium]
MEVKRRAALARRAVATLASVLQEPKSALVRDAAIQRFEYSFEAVWKATQRYLRDVEGVDVASPVAAIRKASAVGLLDEAAARLALEMVGDRNLTVHTYNEPLAEEIFGRLPRYVKLLVSWSDALATRIGD